MNDEIVVEVKNLKKKFKVFFDKGSSLKEKILFKNRNRYEDRWVLNGIDFTMKKGEVIGLIGKNGCGKSTILKMLSRIMYPTEGSIKVKGRVSSLLELGAGFHPDMSGKENIYTNASIFGLTKKEINRRIGDIIAFSELEEYIDNPVRTYSSGMYMRLAFSVAINVDADVLLIDEILAVGDVSFQNKCFEKLKEIKAAGTTIVIVSHSMGQIEQICDRCIWIEEGLIKEDGIPKFVDEHYLKAMEKNRLEKIEKEFHNEECKQQPLNIEKSAIPNFCGKQAVRLGNKKAEIIECKLVDVKKESQKVFQSESEMHIQLTIKANNLDMSADVAISISRDDGLYCYGHSWYRETNHLLNLEKENKIDFAIPNLPLLKGRYYVNIGLYSKEADEYDVIWNAMDFQVASEQFQDLGVFRVLHQWIY